INSDASKSSESLCQPTRTPHQFVFDADDSSVYEASTDDDHHHQDNCNDDDQDIVCQAKKNKLFTKRNLFKIKSNSKNFHKVKANKHDLSSNTLSVDSGLSVPTTTNSDPESEKSLKKPEESQLKRQKRMLALHPDSEHTACYDLTSHRSSMAQTGTELMDTFLRHNSKRFSLKSMAPLAPHKVDEQQCHSLPHSSTKSTVTESKTSRAHASRKSIVRLRLDEAAIGGRVFESSVQVGCGEVAEMGWCADESPKRRHSSMVYVSVAQSKQFNSKSLVADLFSEEMSPTRSMVKRSLSLKNDEEEAKPLKIAVSTKQSFVGVKRSGVRVGPGAEQHRLSVDSGGCGKARAMDDNNNDSGSRSKCLDELELAGVAWSVPNIRKQFERASESKRLVESLASGRRKTINVESGLADNNRDFYLNGIKVQKVNSLSYLGLPIGDHVFKENYRDEKFKKVQKALYSLNGVGCRAFGLEPKILARLYGIYCQPIFNYGIEICHIKKSKLKIYDKSQACIIKRNIGLSKFTKNTAFLEALKVKSISRIYYKYKILFYHQIKKLNPMDELLSYLKLYYNKFKCSEGSFIKQIKDVGKIIDLDPFTEDSKVCMDALDQFYVSKITQIDKAQLYRKIVHLCDLLCKDQVNCKYYKEILYDVLNKSVT
ncbi:hypothetical protein BpHYR1_031464, partial [Brachionus plicatilis]